MAKRPTKKTAPAVDNELLSAIQNATNTNGFMFVSQTDSEPLVAAGLVEVNFEMTDENGYFATRAVTPVSVPNEQEPEQMTEQTTAPAFEIENVALPT